MWKYSFVIFAMSIPGLAQDQSLEVERTRTNIPNYIFIAPRPMVLATVSRQLRDLAEFEVSADESRVNLAKIETTKTFGISYIGKLVEAAKNSARRKAAQIDRRVYFSPRSQKGFDQPEAYLDTIRIRFDVEGIHNGDRIDIINKNLGDERIIWSGSGEKIDAVVRRSRVSNEQKAEGKTRRKQLVFDTLVIQFTSGQANPGRKIKIKLKEIECVGAVPGIHESKNDKFMNASVKKITEEDQEKYLYQNTTWTKELLVTNFVQNPNLLNVDLNSMTTKLEQWQRIRTGQCQDAQCGDQSAEEIWHEIVDMIGPNYANELSQLAIRN